MSLERKATLIAVIAGVVVLAVTFGFSLLARNLSPAPSAAPVAQTTPASPPASASVSSVPNGPTLIAEGKGYYGSSCASCHAADGSGNIGPDLQNTNQSSARIIGIVTNGIGGSMPAFKSTYTPAQISAIAAYVKSLK